MSLLNSLLTNCAFYTQPPFKVDNFLASMSKCFLLSISKTFLHSNQEKSNKEKKKQRAATGTLKIYKAWVRRVRERASVQIIEWRPLCWPQKGSSLPFLLIHHSSTKSIFYHLHCVASSSPSRASSEVEHSRNGNEKTGYEWGVWAIGQIGRWGNLIVSMDGYARTHVIMDLRDLLFDHKNGILE